ncbi:MAG TPA: PHP-associated domain-containing protein, partial [Ktedonobacterales bacterium]|nr:PHP-associated domain-containing protein [Ktedonobacterales bacterium]
MHTIYSDGAATVEQALAHVRDHTRLDVIAITDHDAIEGALRARDLAAQGEYPFEVIVGEEVSTREGHLLTLFITKRIPPGLSIERSIELAHAQGGLAIVAHPFNRLFRFSVQREVMERLWRQPDIHPDGVETLNASFAGIGCYRLATQITRERYHWAETGSSDAHTLNAIGSAHTLYPGSGAEALRVALLERQTQARGGYWPLREYARLYSHHRANRQVIGERRAASFRERKQNMRLADRTVTL